MKHAKHYIDLTASALQLGGGLAQTVRRALKVYSRDGISGLKRGIYLARANIQTNLSGWPSTANNADYSEWVRRYDNLTDEMRSRMRDIQHTFPNRPLISVLMPVCDPKPAWLREAIGSVRAQLYPNWELCIADDASTDPVIGALLEGYANSDDRIKVVFREKNGHISAASNSALTLTTGEWIALLDHDDLLSEHALFWVVDAINRYPDAGLIYSDEDKIDDKGQRSAPYFKPDWNYDLFLSLNYVSHLGIYKTDLVKSLGGLRKDLDGSQDWDLALRCIEQLTPAQIVHIPWVLYHWRLHSDSTAQSGAAKAYARDAGARAVQEHLDRRTIAANVVTESTGYCRVHYDLPPILPLVSLIVPTRNGLELLATCIDSILTKTDYPEYEIIIVDNGSDQRAVLDYLASLEANPQIRVLRDDRPFNFPALNNAAVYEAQGELIGLINNDIEVISPGWLSEMVSLALQPGVGAIGARLWYPDDTLQHGGVILGIGGVAEHAHKRLPRGLPGYFGRATLIQSYSAVTAACLVIRKNIYEQVGGLDEDNLAVAFNDIGFCLKVREAGYRNLWTPYAELYHHESATRGYEDTPDKKRRFSQEVIYMHKTWGDKLLTDPAYNPNLALDRANFALAWPPRSDFRTLNQFEQQKTHTSSSAITERDVTEEKT